MDVTGKGQRTCTNIHRMWDRRWFNGDINVKSVWRPFHAAGSTVGLDIKGSARPEACWFSSCLPCAASALWAETAGIIGPSAELLWAQLGAAWVLGEGGEGSSSGLLSSTMATAGVPLESTSQWTGPCCLLPAHRRTVTRCSDCPCREKGITGPLCAPMINREGGREQTRERVREKKREREWKRGYSLRLINFDCRFLWNEKHY